MSARYGNKVGPLISRKSSFFKKNRYDRNLIKKPITSGGWIRPTDWLTMPTITSSEQKIALLMPIFPQGSNLLAFTIAGAYTVDWGDGNTENVATGIKAQHEYDYADPDLNATVTSGGYKMAVVVITPQSGQNLTSVDFNQKYAQTGSTFPNSSPILEIILSCPNLTSMPIGSATAANVFCKELINFSGINMGGATTYQSLFNNLGKLSNVSFGIIGNITSTASMFGNCPSLVTVPLFNTASVTTMANMFSGCSSLVTVPLFNTAAVTTMISMFSSCFSLTSVPLFNTAAVTTMANMFLTCSSLTSVPLFNTRSVGDMGAMFGSCSSLTSVPLFNTASIYTMTIMFQNCGTLTSVPLFNTASLVIMNGMFLSCSSLTSVPLFNTASVTNMSSLFSGCASLVAVPFFNTAAVTTMNAMFNGCSSLTTVPLFNTAAVTIMSSMFNSCRSLVTVPLFNTALVNTMITMFNGCASLTTVPLFNTASVTNMSSMFNGCSSLVTVPLFNTALVNTMLTMFTNCSSLVSVPLFNTASVTSMSGMFLSCVSLITVPAFNTVLVTNFGSTITSIFSGCVSLTRASFSNISASISYSGCKLNKEELESIFDNLDTGTSPTITITSNWGAPTPVSLTGTSTAQSTTVTMASTTGIEVGMQATGTNSPLTTITSVTLNGTDDRVYLTNHGLSDGDEVAFTLILGTTGITDSIIYYVAGTILADSFQLAATPSGSVLPLTGNGTAKLRYRTEVASIITNTSVTMTRPMAGTSSSTLAFRQLKTGTALLKGWTVTG